MSDKTEEATPKRLLKAQEEGDSPVSGFASQAVAFLCAVFTAKAAITALASRTTVMTPPGGPIASLPEEFSSRFPDQ